MSDSQRFGINEGAVVAQGFGDEVVVINLAKGLYYSMEKTAAAVWEATIAGHDAQAIVEAVSAAYAIEGSRVREDVLAFIGLLTEQHLVVPRAEGNPPPHGALQVKTAGEYVAPRLQVHGDIGHLLALDPPLPALQQNLAKPPRGSDGAS